NYANRHNSYFVWFRVEDQQLQFYKVVNDTFTLKNTVSNIVTNVNQWYDFKITYDRTTGRIAVWRDNVYLGSWTDPSPYSTNGNYISFRTGNAVLNVDELKVYRSRYPQVTVTVGDNSKDIRYQNPNPTTYGAKIKSIVVDANNNLSSIAYHDLNVDWTAPQLFGINDGASNDIDTVYSNTTVYANWQVAVDSNSGIQEYFYALGTTPGGNDVVDWTSAGQNTTITVSGLNLNYGTTYYFSMKATNYAGLTSQVTTSDGFVVSSLNYPMANFSAVEDTVYLPNATVLFVNQSQNATSYMWNFGDGGTSTQVNPWHQYTQAGTYTVQLIAMNPPLPNDTLTLNNYITVLNSQSVETTETMFSLYPNPFTSNIHLIFNTDFSGTVEIIDVLGKVVLSKNIAHSSFLNINGLDCLEKGTYLIKWMDTQKTLLGTKVIVKQ
ncbi:MAG: T9SS type A sorting domain-containing protein, partial [Bacteroidales bacterium]|nr:T9SS type A sorting domain-containing protein [Bacteroidales bacterium]